MIDRIVEIANPARLSVRDCQLLIEREDAGETATPLEDLAVLLIAHQRVSMTQAVLSRVALQGGVVIICDDKHLPAGMLLPVQAHFIQGERFARQTEMPLPLRKRLWQALVRAKIRAQGKLLEELHGGDHGLLRMAACVRSGDPNNLEAQAARRYWPLLFGDPKFRRGGDAEDQNRHLDYGYAVLRAAASRALCAAGLHPSISVRHHNRYNPFSLAADLMEPFRPLVDRRVFQWIAEHDPAGPFDREVRAWMLAFLHDRYEMEGEERTLFDILARTANLLARSVCGEDRAFAPPDGLRPCGG